MILYDYQCTNCQHVFEHYETLEEAENGSGTVACPLCHQPAIRIISNPRHFRHLSWASWRANLAD